MDESGAELLIHPTQSTDELIKVVQETDTSGEQKYDAKAAIIKEAVALIPAEIKKYAKPASRDELVDHALTAIGESITSYNPQSPPQEEGRTLDFPEYAKLMVHHAVIPINGGGYELSDDPQIRAYASAMKRAWHDFTELHGKEPTDTEWIEVTKRYIDEHDRTRAGLAVIGPQAARDREMNSSQRIQDDDMAQTVGLKVALDKAKERLDEREKAILAMREAGYTLEETGKVIGVNKERVRQQESKLFGSLRHPVHALYGFLSPAPKPLQKNEKAQATQSGTGQREQSQTPHWRESGRLYEQKLGEESLAFLGAVKTKIIGDSPTADEKRAFYGTVAGKLFKVAEDHVTINARSAFDLAQTDMPHHIFSYLQRAADKSISMAVGERLYVKVYEDGKVWLDGFTLDDREKMEHRWDHPRYNAEKGTIVSIDPKTSEIEPKLYGGSLERLRKLADVLSTYYTTCRQRTFSSQASPELLPRYPKEEVNSLLAA